VSVVTTLGTVIVVATMLVESRLIPIVIECLQWIGIVHIVSSNGRCILYIDPTRLPNGINYSNDRVVYSVIWETVFTCFEYVVIDHGQHFPFNI
jgi:hypothetical protein